MMRRAGVMGVVLLAVVCIGVFGLATYGFLVWHGNSTTTLDRIGAIRKADGSVMILFHACPGEMVKRVDLVRTDEHFTKSIDVLWAITAKYPASRSSFVVGNTPSGFQLVEDLNEPLQSGDRVGVDVTTSKVGVIPTDFVVADLRTDAVLVGNDYVSGAEFERRARSVCRR